MAQILELSERIKDHYSPGEILGGDIRVVLKRGGQLIEPLPMLWQTNVDVIDNLHCLSCTAADIDYWVVRDAAIVGPGALVQREDKFLFSDTTFPYYVRNFVEHDIMGEYWACSSNTQPLHMPVAISILHFNLVFGHWLTEIFPKILLLKYLLPDFSNVPIILPSTAPRFVFQHLQSVSPRWPIITYNPNTQHVKVDQLILPGSMQTLYNFHPYFGKLLKFHIEEQKNNYNKNQPILNKLIRGQKTKFSPSHIFVSRSEINSSFRNLANAAVIENIACNLGFTVVHPEKMNWEQQVRLFSNAKYIVGEFGSGMHNTIFSPSGARVICLNWIVEVQSRIANFRNHHIGYLLAPDHKPRLFSLSGEFSSFDIDAGEFETALVRILQL